MDMLWIIAGLLSNIGDVVFGGGLFWFYVLFRWANRTKRDDGVDTIDEAYRTTSLGMSLALTALFAGEALGYYLAYGGFLLRIDGLRDVFRWMHIAGLGVMWLHWGYLEVVVMQPFRVVSPTPSADFRSRYLEARVRVRAAVFVQCVLFGIFLLTGIIGRSLRG